MAAFHQTIIIGNLGADPETRFMPSGDAVTNFRVAVTETWKDRNSGEKREKTTWYRVNTFGKLAEICGEYLKKGSQVQIIGKMDQREWEKEGVKQYSWELKADSMLMLGSRQGGGGQGDAGVDNDARRQHQQDKANGYQNAGSSEPKRKAPSFDDMDDDIPF